MREREMERPFDPDQRSGLRAGRRDAGKNPPLTRGACPPKPPVISVGEGGRGGRGEWFGSVIAFILIASPVPAGTLDLSQLETLILKLTNAERARKGLPALVQDGLAQSAARGHSQEMAKLGYAGHESPTPARAKPADRIWLAGITATTHGENVGLHSVSGLPVEELGARMMKGWMESPHHRDNILSPKFTHMGVGGGRGDYQGLDSIFLTQTFLGRPVLEARLQWLGGESFRTFFRLTGRTPSQKPLILYWKEKGEVKFEDVLVRAGHFSHEFILPDAAGIVEILVGFKNTKISGNRTEFHFDFTDRFLYDASTSAVTPALTKR